MGNTLAITEEQTEFTPAQKQALQALGIGAVTPADLQIFLATCQQTGLNPFLKQIYLINRGGKATIQVGIDGLRTVADRVAAKTGEAYGISSPLWCGGDGVWRDVWLSPQYPSAAKVTVQRRHGTFTAIALFREFAPMYNGKLSGLWAKMPAHMIAKVAEAHALRKAFPSEMSGVYTNDEMAQAGPVQVQAKPAQPVQAQQPRQATPVQAPAPARPAAAPQQPAKPAQQVQAPQQPAQPVAATGGDPWAASMTATATPTPAKQPTVADKKKDAEWLKGLETARQELAEQSKKQAARETTK